MRIGLVQAEFPIIAERGGPFRSNRLDEYFLQTTLRILVQLV